MVKIIVFITLVQNKMAWINIKKLMTNTFSVLQKARTHRSEKSFNFSVAALNHVVQICANRCRRMHSKLLQVLRKFVNSCLRAKTCIFGNEATFWEWLTKDPKKYLNFVCLFFSILNKIKTFQQRIFFYILGHITRPISQATGFYSPN